VAAPEALRTFSGSDIALPITKSIVAIGDAVRANGLVWGPGGCFIVTTYQAAFSSSQKRFRTYDWIYELRSDFIKSALSHRVAVGADFDHERGIFRQRFEGQVVAYGDFGRGDYRPQPQRDWAILQLFRPGTAENVCLGADADVRKLSSIGSMPAGVALNQRHLLAIVRRNNGDSALVTTTHGCERVNVHLAICLTHEIMEGSLAIERDNRGEWRLLGLVAEQGNLFGSGFPVYTVSSETIDRALLRYIRNTNLADSATEAYFRARGPFLAE
jgi:hypothetical protein